MSSCISPKPWVGAALKEYACKSPGGSFPNPIQPEAPRLCRQQEINTYLAGLVDETPDVQSWTGHAPSRRIDWVLCVEETNTESTYVNPKSKPLDHPCMRVRLRGRRRVATAAGVQIKFLRVFATVGGFSKIVFRVFAKCMLHIYTTVGVGAHEQSRTKYKNEVRFCGDVKHVGFMKSWLKTTARHLIGRNEKTNVSNWRAHMIL